MSDSESQKAESRFDQTFDDWTEAVIVTLVAPLFHTGCLRLAGLWRENR